MDSRPIIVLGPERSGTSMIAAMIDAWGAYVGEPDDLSEGDERNPRGYWEYKPLWQLAEVIGDLQSGVSWWNETFAEGVAAKVADANLRQEARRLIATMEKSGRPWMWKDPALCHFLGFWAAFWTDPLHVLTVRNPLDIARSWQAFGASLGRLPTSITCNLLRWQSMATTAIAATDHDAADRIFVEYERVLRAPTIEATRLAHFLDARVGNATSAETITEMASVCERALHHNRSGDASTARLNDSQRELYDAQRNRAAGIDAPFDAGRHPMPDGWRASVIAAERGAEESGRASTSEA